MSRADDHDTHTEADAGRHLDAYHSMSRYEAAVEAGYEPERDSPITSPEIDDLVERGRRIAADVKNPESPLHEYAVTEARAIYEASSGRMLEILGLWSAGVESKDVKND